MPQYHRAIRRCGLALFSSAALLTASPALAGDVNIPFNTSNFPAPPAINNITNPLLPLPVGRVWVYRSQSADGCEETRVEVLASLKSIAAGVMAREVHDVVSEDPNCDGTLNKIEDTLDWYAQDNDGNVWYLGEDTKDCDGNTCVQNQGSWEAGADFFGSGTLGIAGIIMLKEPRTGDSYSQEFYKDHAEDVGAVVGTDLDVTLTRDDALQPKLFHHCLKTKERSLLEPGSTAHKFYCPDIGLMVEQELSRGHVRVELIDPSALAFQFRTVPKRR